jgi:hypothetical protein
VAKQPARKLVLSIGATPTPIGHVVAMGEAGSSRDLIDASEYGQDFKDYVVGQQDGDEMEVTVALNSDAGQTALKAAYASGVSEDFEMEHADAAFHIGFPALVTRLSRGGDLNGLLTMKATLKILAPGISDIP